MIKTKPNQIKSSYFCLLTTLLMMLTACGGNGLEIPFDGVENAELSLGSLHHPKWDKYCAEGYSKKNMRGLQYELHQTGEFVKAIPSALRNNLSSLAIAPNCSLQIYVDNGLDWSNTPGREATYIENRSTRKGEYYYCNCPINRSEPIDGPGTIVAWALEHEEGVANQGYNKIPLFHDRMIDFTKELKSWKNKISAIEFLDTEFGSVMFQDLAQKTAEKPGYSVLVPQMADGEERAFLQDAGVGYRASLAPTTPDFEENWNNKIDRIWAWATHPVAEGE